MTQPQNGRHWDTKKVQSKNTLSVLRLTAKIVRAKPTRQGPAKPAVKAQACVVC